MPTGSPRGMQRTQNQRPVLDDSELSLCVSQLTDLVRVQAALSEHLRCTQGRFTAQDAATVRALEIRFAALRAAEARRVTEYQEVCNAEVRILSDEEGVKLRDLAAKEAILQELCTKREDEGAAQSALDDEANSRERQIERAVADATDAAEKVVMTHQKLHQKKCALQDAEAKAAALQGALRSAQDALAADQRRAVAAHQRRDEAKVLRTAKRHELNVLLKKFESEQAEWRAERDTFTYEVESLSRHLNETVDRLAPSAELQSKLPDFTDTLSRLEIKDGVLHSALRTMELQDARARAESISQTLSAASLRAEVLSLRLSIDHLENTCRDSGRRVGVCDRPLLAVYPDPCRTDGTLTLVVTACDAVGRPVLGLRKSDVQCRAVRCTAGGSSVGESLAIEPLDTAAHALQSHCVFTATLKPSEAGRAGFVVKCGGAEHVATARIISPADDPSIASPGGAAAAAGDHGPFTVACSPDGLTVGDCMLVTVVMREPGSWEPRQGGDLPQPGDFDVSPLGAAAGAEQPELKRIPDAPVYTAAVVLTDAFAQLPHAGCVVRLGDSVVSGTARFVCEPGTVDPLSVTVSCAPCPCRVGQQVVATVVLRDSLRRLAPVVEADLGLEPFGNVDAMHSLEYQSPGVWCGTFIAGSPDAESTGRVGVDVVLGGNTVCRGSVEVVTHGGCDPLHTQLCFDPASVAGAGDVVRVLITTCDASGCEAPGPEPSQLRLLPRGAAGNVSSVTRRSGSASRYAATFEVCAESDTAGVVVSFDGGSVRAQLSVVCGPTRPGLHSSEWVRGEQQRPPQATLVSFAADPVAPGCEVDVLVSGPDHGGSPRRAILHSKPTLAAAKNVASVESQPVPFRGSTDMWVGRVRIGQSEGTAAVVCTFGQTQTRASTSVVDSVEGGAAAAILWEQSRLSQLQLSLQDAASAGGSLASEVAAVTVAERDADDAASALSAARSRAEAALVSRADGKVKLEHVVCGFGLSDGIAFKTHVERLSGAKVCDVWPDGPAEVAGVAAGDVVTAMAADRSDDGAPLLQQSPVRSVADFRSLLQVTRSAQAAVSGGPPPMVLILSVHRGSKKLSVRLRPDAAQYPHLRRYVLKHPRREGSPSPRRSVSPRA
eukprot:TRINITY_DN20301_c0_g1_i1.p1 TRINITY_DN20301_c0_g1~~TRINITY_DN20301_c0_g1_i1.p1  ORF type:complete len:1138 (+),score=184.27 TRINITY_DN20301_c0_g1_i1:67-3414(+)